jgi:hypothetical protein
MNINKIISTKKPEIIIFSVLLVFLFVIGSIFIEPESNVKKQSQGQYFLDDAELYPDGFLIIMAAKGHTIQKHVGKTDTYLRRRLENESIPAASTFINMREAEEAIRNVLHERGDLIQAWLDAGRSNRKAFYANSNDFVGRIIERGSVDSQPANGTRIILVRDQESDYGFMLLTAYPEIRD